MKFRSAGDASGAALHAGLRGGVRVPDGSASQAAKPWACGRHVFTKLDISSRAELSSVFPGDTRERQPV